MTDISPSERPPFFVLGGALGSFSAISAPKVQFEVEEIRELNRMGRRHEIMGASFGAITLSRGIRGGDVSLWTWLKRAMEGSDIIRRDLALLVYTSAPITPFGGIGGGLGAVGRMFILRQCLPTELSVADFDASSSAVQIDQIVVQPESIQELAVPTAVFA